MSPAPYEAAPLAIRADLAAAHRRARDHLARPGAWWDGRQRVALIAETRNARQCRLCRERKEALSPAIVTGMHDSLGELPEAAVEAVHRIRTDPGRLTRSWFDNVIRSALTPEQYVEIVSVVAHTVALDTFARGVGIPPLPLPDASDGAPSCHRPSGPRQGPAWVPWTAPEHPTAPEPGIHPTARPPAALHRAMRPAPARARSVFALGGHH